MHRRAQCSAITCWGYGSRSFGTCLWSKRPIPPWSPPMGYMSISDGITKTGGSSSQLTRAHSW